MVSQLSLNQENDGHEVSARASTAAHIFKKKSVMLGKSVSLAWTDLSWKVGQSCCMMKIRLGSSAERDASPFS